MIFTPHLQKHASKTTMMSKLLPSLKQAAPARALLRMSHRSRLKSDMGICLTKRSFFASFWTSFKENQKDVAQAWKSEALRITSNETHLSSILRHRQSYCCNFVYACGARGSPRFRAARQSIVSDSFGGKIIWRRLFNSIVYIWQLEIR